MKRELITAIALAVLVSCVGSCAKVINTEDELLTAETVLAAESEEGIDRPRDSEPQDDTEGGSELSETLKDELEAIREMVGKGTMIEGKVTWSVMRAADAIKQNEESVSKGMDVVGSLLGEKQKEETPEERKKREEEEARTKLLCEAKLESILTAKEGQEKAEDEQKEEPSDPEEWKKTSIDGLTFKMTDPITFGETENAYVLTGNVLRNDGTRYDVCVGKVGDRTCDWPYIADEWNDFFCEAMAETYHMDTPLYTEFAENNAFENEHGVQFMLIDGTLTEGTTWKQFPYRVYFYNANETKGFFAAVYFTDINEEEAKAALQSIADNLSAEGN